MTPFDRAFLYVVGREKEYSDDPKDPGNWTGGEVDKGELKGTKWGISAAAYPQLDIRNLTISEAEDIYRRDYWALVSGDKLPPALAIAVFDAAVNQGVMPAITCLQRALEVRADGIIGPRTLGAIRRFTIRELIERYQAERILRYMSTARFDRNGRGWIRRAVGTAMEAIT